MNDPMDDLVYRLRYPAYSWSEAFGSNLDKEETIADMSEAADEITTLTTLTSRAEQDAKRIEELTFALTGLLSYVQANFRRPDQWNQGGRPVVADAKAAIQRGGA